MIKKLKKHEPFGLHLMLDLYDCSPNMLNDEHRVGEMLDVLIGKIGMRKLMEPFVLKAEPNGKRDPGGWSGFVMIQESHISIHTFVKRRFVTVDVYSCKSFEPNEVVEYFKDVFETGNVEKHIIGRGSYYPPRNID